VGREALESSSAVLQTAANPSQLPAQQKRPGVAWRLALCGSKRVRCHKRKGNSARDRAEWSARLQSHWRWSR